MQVCDCRLVWYGNRSLKVLLIHRFVYINSFVLLDQLVTLHHLSISITAEDAKAAARQRIGFTRELEQPRTVLNMVSPVQRGTRGYDSMSD